MTLRDFVKKNRKAIDSVIDAVTDCDEVRLGPAPKRTDDERKEWVWNDPVLRSMARCNGVRI